MLKNHGILIVMLLALVSSGCASIVTLDRTVTSDEGVVVCVDHIAAQVGALVLYEGGNAVDAAVAMGFALAVTHPQAGNLGGGGFMVLRTGDGITECIDYREKAPLASRPGMYLNPDGTVNSEKRDLGFLGSGVPGTPAGLELAHRLHGRTSWRLLLQPAIDLAARGFEVDADLAAALKRHEKKLALFETTRRTYFRKNGTPLEEGDRLVQPGLAETLTQIRDRGAAGFYHGRVAEELIRAIRDGGGVMTLEDLAAYEAIVRAPVTGSFRGLTLVGMPLPSSGGTVLLQMLNILDGFDLAGMSDAQRMHILAETMRRAFRERAAYLGDSDFVQVPIERLLSPEHARQLRTGIDMTRATDSREIAGEIVVQEPEDEKKGVGDRGPLQTTHFSIMDSEGNMVSNTYTLEETFGCKTVAGATGVLMNNEMGDFNTRPEWTDTTGVIGTPANRIAPGKRMLSSMCPLIVLRDGEPYAVLGSPGGRTIINTVLQVFLNLAVLELGPGEAVAAPRIHHQWFPDRIQVEAALDGAIRTELERMGHAVKERKVQGDCHIIVVDPGTGEMTGVADRRIDGFAAGLD